MADNKIYKNDIGTVLEVEAEDPADSQDIDLSTATVLRLEITKQGASSSVNWAANAKAGDNSVAQYTVVAGDFSVAGVYVGQVYAEWDVNNKFHGATFKFTVYELGQ